MGVDARGQRRRVGNLQRDVALPLRLEGRDVDDDPAARVGRFAQADREDIARDAKIFHRTRQGKGVRRHDANIGLEVHERFRIELLRIDDGVENVGKDFEFVAHA